MVGTTPGTIYGASIGYGEVGGAFNFDGVDDYIDIAPMNIGVTFTIELWVHPTSGA